MKKGSIALTTVIVIMGMLLLAGITLVLSSVDLSQSTKDFQSYKIAETKSYTCLEESVRKIKLNTNYTGTYSYTDSQGSCNATVSAGTPATTKTIVLNATVGEYNFSVTKHLDTTVNPFKYLD